MYRWLQEWVLVGSALIIGWGFILFPFFIAYLIYRLFERALIWRMDQALRYPAGSSERSYWFDEKRRYEKSAEMKRGYFFSAIGFVISAIWVAFVLGNWNRIGAVFRGFGTIP